jgi:hypothetical protein
MNFSFLYPSGENLKDKSDKDGLAINKNPLSMNEGSEFLDDSIRMKDMPLMFSEEAIDTGRSRYLL